jgi:hypothetical protein
VQRRGVVNAIAHVTDDVPSFLEGEDYPFLLVGLHLGKDIELVYSVEQCCVAYAVQVLSREHPQVTKANGLPDVPCHEAVVAGNDLERTAEVS